MLIKTKRTALWLCAFLAPKQDRKLLKKRLRPKEQRKRKPRQISSDVASNISALKPSARRPKKPDVLRKKALLHRMREPMTKP
jgi:hypothetical protein